MHEVGHALKLKHTDYIYTKNIIKLNEVVSYNQVFNPAAIMSTNLLDVHPTITTYITMYDKANLIRKWREMP